MIRFLNFFIFIFFCHQIFAVNIILINGVSCVGKTTTAKALADRLQQDGVATKIFSIDDFYRTDLIPLSDKITKFCMQKNINFQLPINPSVLAYGTWHQKIKQEVERYDDAVIIVDHSLSYIGMFLSLLYEWKDIPSIFFVKLFCNREVAEQRLLKRNTIDDNKQNYRYSNIIKVHFHENALKRVYHNKIYDLEVDSSQKNTEQCVTDILKGLEQHTNSSFHQNYKKYQTELTKSNYDQAMHSIEPIIFPIIS